MPPRTSLTSSFSVADTSNEVVCPLKNPDGTSCRKRCFGEKRYRSMQEHIRRAHQEHYIPKLPATEESFLLMINTAPHERPAHAQQHHAQQQQQAAQNRAANHYGTSNFDPVANNYYAPPDTSPIDRAPHDYRRPSYLPAAQALAQLSTSRPDPTDWDAEGEAAPFDTDQSHNYFAGGDSQNLFADAGPNLDHMSPLTAIGPGNRPSSSWAQIHRARMNNRARKSSIAEDARKPKHERERSKDHKRLSADLNKRLSSEQPGKRWEDLLDAAASATEEDSRDLTPIPQSPRGSQPPFQGQNHNQFQSYNTSPLQNAVFPHSPAEGDAAYPQAPLEPFPSVEDPQFDGGAGQQQPYHHHQSSGESSAAANFGFPRHDAHPSGSNFHIPPEGLSSSPNDAAVLAHSHMRNYSTSSFPSAGPTQQPATQLVQHYCAACHRITPLVSSFGCTECMCGICKDCFDVLIGMSQDRSTTCPRCGSANSRFKPFMLDLR